MGASKSLISSVAIAGIMCVCTTACDPGNQGPSDAQLASWNQEANSSLPDFDVNVVYDTESDMFGNEAQGWVQINITFDDYADVEEHEISISSFETSIEDELSSTDVHTDVTPKDPDALVGSAAARLSKNLEGFAGLETLWITYERHGSQVWRGDADLKVFISHVSEVDDAWLDTMADALQSSLDKSGADLASVMFVVGESPNASDAPDGPSLTLADFTALADAVRGEACVATESWAFSFESNRAWVEPLGTAEACA